MEKLTTQQRLKVSKMSDERLRSKLVHAGYKEEDDERMNRTRLLATYAQILLVETAYVPARDESDEEDSGDREEEVNTEGEEQIAVAVAVGGSLEERRLLLEERKLEEQRMQRELEERKL